MVNSVGESVEGGFNQHGRSHTKQLIKFGVLMVIIVLAAAVVFDYLNKGAVVQKEEGFSESYCLSLLEKNHPGVSDVGFGQVSDGYPYKSKTGSLQNSPTDVVMYGAYDNSVAGCSASSSYYQSSSLKFNDEFNCSENKIRYASGRAAGYLYITIERELPESVISDNVVIIDNKENAIPRFFLTSLYMNPTERAYWQEQAGILSNHEC